MTDIVLERGMIVPRILHLVPGQVGASCDAGLIFTAVVGAGVAVCLCDPIARVGGVAYFLFPGGADHRGDETRFAQPAINALLGRLEILGAQPDRLEAKMFGGARLHDGARDIGRRAADFAADLLDRRRIHLVAGGLGGGRVRRIQFSPTTAQCDVTFLGQVPDL